MELSMKKKLVVVAGIIKQNNKVLCCKRKDFGECGNKWEFPGGKVELGENKEEALIREIKEELDCVAVVKELITIVNHEYNSYFVNLSVYYCEIEGTPKLLEHAEFKWCEIDKLKELNFVEADYQFLDLIK